MFRSALVRRHSSRGKSIDAGLIAETLLFYGQVHVVADKAILTDLITTLGEDALTRLITEHGLKLIYTRSIPAVMKETQNYVEMFLPSSITIVAKHAGAKKITVADEINEITSDTLGNSRKSRNFARFLCKNSKFRRIGPTDEPDSFKTIEYDLLDQGYLERAVKQQISMLVPSWDAPENLMFKMLSAGDRRYYALTNLNFDALNQAAKRDGITLDELSVERLLSHINDARIDLDLSLNYMSDLITTDTNAELIRTRLLGLLKKRSQNEQEILQFQEIHLGDARAIRDAINSGARDFAEFLPLLKRASKFKSWLADVDPDARLLNEFYKATTADSWATFLPTKLMRYMFTSIAGFAGLVPGLAVGAVDELFLDGLLKGWRPNQFVDGPLKSFIETK
jgi:hypothetical protein